VALRIVAGRANPALAEAVAAGLGGEPVPYELERFSDGEIRPMVGSVRGDDVYVIQSTSPSVNEHLVELLLVVDACRRAGALRVTAVVPYFGYARQDRRSRQGESIGVRVATNVIAASGADRLVVIDPHTTGFEAICPIPTEILTAVPLLVGALDTLTAHSQVVVAPDLGAMKLAERFAALRRLPVAVVRKNRLTGSSVVAEELVGEVEGRRAVIVDDMIATGATIEAAARLLDVRGAAPRPVVVATHGLLVGPAIDRLDRLELDRLFVTDTVILPDAVSVEVCSVAPLLAETIGHLHEEEPLDNLVRSD
jgi:ribose-phosphate pyrophosphokinase